ncbi:MAG: hypothetical protein ABSF43_13790 [Rectinemataceae bacterium]|jgi:hypothetical protein
MITKVKDLDSGEEMLFTKLTDVQSVTGIPIIEIMPAAEKNGYRVTGMYLDYKERERVRA